MESALTVEVSRLRQEPTGDCRASWTFPRSAFVDSQSELLVGLTSEEKGTCLVCREGLSSARAFDIKGGLVPLTHGAKHSQSVPLPFRGLPVW